MSEFRYGEPLEVYTFTGWEVFDWDMYETPEDACEALSDFEDHHIRVKGCPAPRPKKPKGLSLHG